MKNKYRGRKVEQPGMGSVDNLRITEVSVIKIFNFFKAVWTVN